MIFIFEINEIRFSTYHFVISNVSEYWVIQISTVRTHFVATPNSEECAIFLP